MKKLVLVMAMAISVLTMVSFSYASWHVDITNNCKQDVRVEVYGDRFFVERLDCNVTVPAGGSKKCTLPGAYCLSSAKTTVVDTNKLIGHKTFNGGRAACGNDKVVLDPSSVGCKMSHPYMGVPNFFPE